MFATSSRALLLVGVAAVLLDGAAPRAEPAPAAQIPGYFDKPMPCKLVKSAELGRTVVQCKDGLLENKSLRELSIMRNTIFARYGWDGYRKAWLRDYFHAQPWFRPNPKFSYRMLSDVDRKNAHFIGVRESSLSADDLEAMRARLLAAHPHRDVTPMVAPEALIELGLIERALGQFATDDDRRARTENDLDGLLALDDLRKLSLRDLRLLRNTIYARRGRTFKSQLLQEHFDGMRWYKRNAAYSDRLLSANDRRNIKQVRAVEDELGGPLRDEDFLIEPNVDGA